MKKIIPIGVIIVSMSIAYYFFLFLPTQKQSEIEQQKKAFLFNKQTECKNICEKLYKDDISSMSEENVFNPKYAYNENLNACFYSGGYVSEKTFSNRVVNCQTNEEVLTFMTLNDKVFTDYCDTCVENTSIYEEKEKELMGK